ncbi:hypothetical protein [Methylobacterium platani]|uniref:Major facilitator superfamily (MFS) profile domain-containing protein n=2 Tax=Methylobacterium platani TaxID=427683 RepID=A0A179S5Z6_9HYPH|nr:hypothetical protein [Methylobacterium platani]KMO19510.1 hypothetical protein SQ03_07755 [Methylobacterium platani JCM 14648]OAS19927.1 hypothetical protein A5481_22670 [Methylobacterium platani]
MLLLASVAWPGLLAALLIGAGTGWWAGPPTTTGARLSAAAVALLAVAAGAAALAGLVLKGLAVPGREGFRLETAALMLAAYLVGCVLGALVPRRA